VLLMVWGLPRRRLSRALRSPFRANLLIACLFVCTISEIWCARTKNNAKAIEGRDECYT
jgi:hypothetical protein